MQFGGPALHIAFKCVDARSIEPGGADYGMCAEAAPRLEVPHHHVGPGELDDDVHPPQRLGVFGHADTADFHSGAGRVVQASEAQILGGCHRLGDQATHEARRTRDSNRRHEMYSSRSVASKGPTAPSTNGPS